MLDTTLFQLLVFCFKLMTINEPIIDLQITTQDNQKIIIICETFQNGGIVYLKKENTREYFFKYENVENGMCRITLKENETFLFNISAMISKIDLQKIATKKQSLKDESGNVITITPDRTGITIEYSNKKLKIKILKKYLQN